MSAEASPATTPGRWRPSALLKASAAVHLAALAGVVLAPERWPLALGAFLGNHVVLAGVGMWPRSTLLGENVSRLPASSEVGDAIALTFDDGPDPEVTPWVLDLLDEAGARASFFCIGRRALEHPETVAEIAARGHRVENHSFRHSHLFSLLGPLRLGREIDRTQETLAGITGRRPIFFRAPAGIRGPWLEPVLARRRLTLVSWTRRGFDSVDREPARVSRRLVDGVAAGDILLVHDGALHRRSGHGEATLEVVRRVLEALRTSGLRAVALPDEVRRR